MLAVLLPVGALTATAAGVGAAGLFGYSTVPATFVCVIAVVAAVLTATAALARVWPGPGGCLLYTSPSPRD